jgi:agmatinase
MASNETVWNKKKMIAPVTANLPTSFAGSVAFMLLLASGSARAEWDVPGTLQPAVDSLAAPQAEFITSGSILEFIPERQLEHELGNRDHESLARFVSDLMALAEQMAYDPERDMGAAPLNLESRSFHNGNVTTPPELRELEREPGPFSVHRYMFPQSGVPTFGGARVAVWPEDLVAGNVDVAIAGIPNNASSGRRDSGNGPDAMRAMDTIATPDVQSLVKPLESLSVVDYGDFGGDYMSTQRSVPHVTAMVAETAGTGAVPMLVGGDTSMLYPGVKGVAEVRGPGSFGLLYFSAHPDVDRYGDHMISDRQAIFRLIDQGIVNGGDTIQVGLRGPDVDVETLTWLRDNNVLYHTMAEIRQRGFERVLRRVQREVDRGPDAFFVSIDVSAIDPADLVAAGRATSHGMPLADVIRAIRHVCASKDIAGFEITDLAPMLDVSPQSVMHANAVLNACLVGMAIRKEDLDPDYVHPLALDHGQ